MAEKNGGNSFQQSEDAMLQLAYYRALELADFKGGFLARTAHELRSPLNKVISLQQMILEGLCDDIDEEREFVAEAHAASMRLLEYLDFLIRVSKIEAGRLLPSLKTVSLSTIFAEVKERNHLQVADRNLGFVVEPPDESLKVYTDPQWVQNILTTLIDIALDSSDRGSICLSVAPNASSECCYLWLDDDRPDTHWQESTALPVLRDFDLDNTLSASLRMGLVEAMIKALGGHVSLLSTTSDQAPTRLQIALPAIAN
jgi:hypothetical protein